MVAHQRRVDGTELEWSWEIRKDGRLRINTRITPPTPSKEAFLDPLIIRSVYQLEPAASDPP